METTPDIQLRLGDEDWLLHGWQQVALPHGMESYRSATVPHDPIEVHLCPTLPHPDTTLLDERMLLDGQCRMRFGIDAQGGYHYTFGGGGKLYFSPDGMREARLAQIDDPALMRYALWLVQAMCGQGRGVVPLHSSAVVHQERAVLCLGESGTGKSTHTRLWMQHIADSWLLNDDSPLVRVDGNGVEAYGSPWSGKTPCYSTEHYPIAALVRLRQAPHNRMRRAGVAEAMGSLLPSCPPTIAKAPQLFEKLVDWVAKVVEQVPVYVLECRPDADAAHLCHQTIFGT